MSGRVVLVDHQELYRSGVKALLSGGGFQVIGETSNGRTALELVKKLAADIVVLEGRLPGWNGLAVAKAILAAQPQTRIVFLTGHLPGLFIWDALKAGASGFLSKSSSASCLLTAIRAISQGVTYVDPTSARCISTATVIASVSGGAEADLSIREIEVLGLIAKGKASKEIAALLGISQKTADSHRYRIGRKLGLSGQVELVRFAVRTGMAWEQVPSELTNEQVRLHANG